MDLLEERRKDREERRQERMEREQEKGVRVRELQEREHEREERRKEREERELEREERRREREERVRSGVHYAGQRIGKKDIGFGIEKRSDELLGGIPHEPFDVTQGEHGCAIPEDALEAEQKKVNALVEYIYQPIPIRE